MKFSVCFEVFTSFAPLIFPLSVLLTGGWLTIMLKGMPLRRPLWVLKTAIRQLRPAGKGGLSSFQASATALAGALGTGNITGVAVALTVGGPGAIFWMWVCGLVGMVLKYSEILLAVRYQRKNGTSYAGGPMYYLEAAFGSVLPGIFFAGSCLAASFGIGCLAQAGAAADALSGCLDLPPWVTGMAMAALLLAVLMGGIQRIGTLTQWLVPVMGLLYLGGTLGILLPHLDQLPALLRLIIADAFSFTGASGGGLGFLTSRALRTGMVRGVFTNEAGMGSAPIVHGAASARSPVEEGAWGVVEVFLDTIVMCTLTAAVILLSGCLDTVSYGLTVAAFGHFWGQGAALFVGISSFVFGFSSILCWSYYGEAALSYLGGKKRACNVYRLICAVVVAAGTVCRLETVFRLSDLLNFLMAAPNLLGLLALTPEIRRQTLKYFEKIDKNQEKVSNKMKFLIFSSKNRQKTKHYGKISQ